MSGYPIVTISISVTGSIPPLQTDFVDFTLYLCPRIEEKLLVCSYDHTGQVPNLITIIIIKQNNPCALENSLLAFKLETREKAFAIFFWNPYMGLL